MDAVEIGVLIGGVVSILFTLWFFFGGRRSKAASSDDLRYACPMHPWIQSDDPTATCSICNMKLVAR